MREAEKKKQVLRKTTYKGPVIRYLSKTTVLEDGAKESRNYVTFSDEQQLYSLFATTHKAVQPVAQGVLLGGHFGAISQQT